MDHVCTNSNSTTNIMLLWSALSDGPNMTEVKSLEKIEKYLKDCNQDIITQCSGKDNEEAQDFRRRCNSFFMEVISLLCFGTGTPPSVEVIDKLFTYITGPDQSERAKKVGSKKLTIFDASMDQSPVIRSFLLQQIIASCSDKDVQEYLSVYFTHAKELLNTAKQPDQYIELCILLLHCLEDSLHQRHTGNDKTHIATQMLTDALQKISMDINILEKIKYIANVKFALVCVAQLIHEMNYTTSHFKTLDETKKRLLEAASCICENSKSLWPRKFLVKQLCRCHGIDMYHAIVKSDDTSFHWVCLPELRGDYLQIKECNDRYIMFGEDYKELRDAVGETIFTENSAILEQMLQKENCGWQKRIQLLLALHREICLKNIKGEQVFSEKGTSFLRGYLRNHAIMKNKVYYV
ncbi:E3 ubiquitin-protein ligase RNF213-like [Mytilus edulis]|uniref:E3 ubiquitin-protein ligase RNF213-like n=1 Tax=Mytilus edulis TaxID=6550 RepID=UPI0039F09971